MAAVEPRSSETALAVAGAVIALSGLAGAAALLSANGPTALSLLSQIGLAVGAVVLVLGRTGIVGPSLVARGALLLFGVAFLVYRLEPAPGPWSVLVGMLTLLVVTAATVVSAVMVARTGRVHGVARWALLLVALDALLVAVMSTVPVDGLVLAYLRGHLELVRPIALLVWGVALVVQSAAVRRRIAAAVTDWRRSTDVAGASRTDIAPEATRSRAD